jgi:hypothetical protein
MALPYNPKFHAYNVLDLTIDESRLREIRDLFESEIRPIAGAADGPVRVAGLTLNVRRPPGWSSDLRWWSAADESTFAHFTELFQSLRVDERRFPAPISLGSPRIYSASIFVRSWCRATHFHTDFFPTCATSVYTLITPLEPSPQRGGNLVYRDADGSDRIYEYRFGEALAFGALLSHGTEVTVPGPPRAFLSFIFGARDIGCRRALDKTLDYCGCMAPPR